MVKKIVCTPGTCGGSPRIEGHRLTCADITLALYFHFSVLTYIRHYPDITEDDIHACLEYCANEQCLNDKPINFCYGCLHDRRPEEKPAFFINNPDMLDEYARNADSILGHAFWGTEEQYEKDSKPKRLWKFAAKCLEDLSACPIIQPKQE